MPSPIRYNRLTGWAMAATVTCMQGDDTGRMDPLAAVLWIGDLAGKLIAVAVIVALAGLGLVLGIVFVAGVIAFAMTRLGRRTEYMTRPE